MQPYFFPYPGYFSLIKHVDRFILLDSVQFIRHGWVDRNRMLRQGEGWLYIRPALHKHSLGTLIKDARIDDDRPWRKKMLSQLEPYRKSAPFYRPVRRLVEQVLAEVHGDIVALDKAALEAVLAYLGIGRKIETFSEMGLAIDPPRAADEWALNICRALGGVTEYWNPPGGESFMDRAKYEEAGISLRFLRPVLKPYDQRREGFEPGLSILDAMMFNPPERVNAMLDDYELA
jgi:hypothetical protein